MATAEQYAALTRRIAAEEFPNDPQMQEVFYRQMAQESGNFSPDVVEGRRLSTAGAMGIAQFMPGTAKSVGLTNPFDPEAALHAGARYLKQNIASFSGDVAKGLAAYNAGPGAVQDALAGGGPNWIAALPAETQSYLSIILGQGGGATMADGATMRTTDYRSMAAAEWAGIEQAAEQAGVPVQTYLSMWLQLPPYTKDTYISARASQLQKEMGGETISPYEAGRLELDWETLLENTRQWEQTHGLDVAAQMFANEITRAQEARARAEFATEYAMQQAPAGMTEYPGREPTGAYATYMREHGIEPREPVPLPKARLPADPWALLARGGADLPQFQYQPPPPASSVGVPGAPGLPGLPALPEEPTTATAQEYVIPWILRALSRRSGGAMPTPQPTGLGQTLIWATPPATDALAEAMRRLRERGILLGIP